MIGILQGRLTASTNGQLQCFPSINWKDEFILAKNCKLECIELLFEAVYNPLNPLYTSDGIPVLKKISKETGVRISSVCADYFMQKPLWNNDGNAKKESEKTFKELVLKCNDVDAGILVLPFFEKAEIKTEQDKNSLGEVLSELGEFAKDHSVDVSLEITIPATSLKFFIESLNSKNIGVCYDTGNTTGKGHDISKDIKILGNLINHVHVKDRRKSDYQNVLLGTGDTDFKGAFLAFNNFSYKRAFMLETYRGENPVETAKKHRIFVEKNLQISKSV